MLTSSRCAKLKYTIRYDTKYAIRPTQNGKQRNRIIRPLLFDSMASKLQLSK